MYNVIFRFVLIMHHLDIFILGFWGYINGLILEHIGYEKNRVNKNVQYSHKDSRVK